jgi:hypothetical protein
MFPCRIRILYALQRFSATYSDGASLVRLHMSTKRYRYILYNNLNYYRGQVSKRKPCFVELPDENPSIVYRLVTNGDEWLRPKTT